MPSWTICGAILRIAARQPAGWLLLAGLLLGWRGLEIFMPLGLATEGLHRSAGHYEIAFVGGVLAMLLTVSPLRRFAPLLGKQGPVARTLTELLSLVTVAAIVGLCVLIPAHWLDLWQYASFSAPRSAGAGLLGWVHAAALIAVVGLRPRGPATRPARGAAGAVVATVLLLFVLPGLLPGARAPGRAALTLLDAGRNLRASFDFPLSGAQWWLALVPILGWASLAAALAAPRTAPPDAHALRHPR